MKNCEVKQYKKATNADLPLYGKLVFEVGANQQTPVWDMGNLFSTNANHCTVSLTGTASLVNASGETIAVGGEEYTFSGNYQAKIVGGAEGGRLIGPKYTLQALNFFYAPKFDSIPSIVKIFNGNISTVKIKYVNQEILSGFDGKTGIRVAELGGSSSNPNKPSGDIKNLTATKSTLENLNIAESNIYGDIAYIAGSELKSFDGFRCPVSGNISSLGVCTKLTHINVFNSAVNGSIEDFVKAQIANGRTTLPSMEFIVANAGITWKGANVTSFGGALSWTSDGTTATITFNSDTETVEL